MELTKMCNIGTEISRKLGVVGIHTAEELQEIGSKEAFFRLKAAYPEVCLVHLYTLEGAITNLDYNRLPEDKKAELKAYNDSLK